MGLAQRFAPLIRGSATFRLSRRRHKPSHSIYTKSWLEFKLFPCLKKKPCCGNHFWAKGYYVDMVKLDTDMIRKHVKYQEDSERHQEQLALNYD